MLPRYPNNATHVQVCDAHISAQLQQLASHQTSSSVMFLEQMNECWQDHCSQMLIIRSIFLYLDRTYVISDSTVRSIFDMGLRLFRLHLATHPEVCSKDLVASKQLGNLLCHAGIRLHQVVVPSSSPINTTQRGAIGAGLIANGAVQPGVVW